MRPAMVTGFAAAEARCLHARDGAVADEVADAVGYQTREARLEAADGMASQV